ncbi:NTP transferase domain-containing protein [Lentibacillus sp. N15]|uniref:NTP transferase domain-containing protein n=1 Tax=Lentibacillus songyuanensis TaxID=3136161 RepID=UPI0031BB2914
MERNISSTESKIVAIYLAAGKSKRFGKNKLQQPLGNVSLGSVALRTALQSTLDRIVVVIDTADELDWIPTGLFSTYQIKWFHTTCMDTARGQSYSLKCGLQFAEKLQATAVMVILADQPFISVDMINKLIEQHTIHPDTMFVAATFSNVPCPPILFTSSMFPKLFQLKGDNGARQLLQHESEKGQFVPFSDSLAFFDIDTVTDYQKIRNSLLH